MPISCRGVFSLSSLPNFHLSCTLRLMALPLRGRSNRSGICFWKREHVNLLKYGDSLLDAVTDGLSLGVASTYAHKRAHPVGVPADMFLRYVVVVTR